MANDPALAADGCIYMEAIAGDGGAHDVNAVWWLSPDVALVGATSGPDKADPGAANTVTVSLHSHGGNCAMPPGTESITIELWVANPSLAMAPNNAISTTHIDSIGVPVFGLGAGTSHQFLWTPPNGVAASDPQSPGHKCLIARCYPDPLIPSNTSFFSPDDPHVAQHNICIVPCGGPGAARKPGTCGQSLRSVNPDTKKPQRLRLRAVFDLEPDKRVREIVLARLKKTEGFKGLTKKPPRGFLMRVEGVKAAKPSDNSKGSRKGAPSYELDVAAGPGETFMCHFVSDLTGAHLGEAHVFHVTQIGEDKRPHGGITIVTLAI